MGRADQRAHEARDGPSNGGFNTGRKWPLTPVTSKERPKIVLHHIMLPGAKLWVVKTLSAYKIVFAADFLFMFVYLFYLK
jgi:hypothetical protein